MIHYIKRKDLDIDKYDTCIENSLQSRVYAFSWYLDIVADNWDVLVLNDYKVVMPIPWKIKYGIKYVTQPSFCQQLGIFSIENISENFQLEMIAKVPNKFLKVSLSLNSNNILKLKNKTRKNYILRIDKDFSEIKKGFSKGRKHAIKVGEKQNLQIKATTLKELLKIQTANYQYKIPNRKLLALENYILKNNKGCVLGVFKEGHLLGGGFFIKSKSRMIYLYAAFTKEARNLQASSFLISEVIKDCSNLILDFEGGNMPNMERFYRSFGAESEEFQKIDYSKLPFL